MTDDINGAENLKILNKAVVQVEPPVNFKKTFQFSSSEVADGYKMVDEKP